SVTGPLPLTRPDQAQVRPRARPGGCLFRAWSSVAVHGPRQTAILRRGLTGQGINRLNRVFESFPAAPGAAGLMPADPPWPDDAILRALRSDAKRQATVPARATGRSPRTRGRAGNGCRPVRFM